MESTTTTTTNDIYDFTKPFDFSQLFLTYPAICNGGNYFIKYILSNDKALYVQPPKCTTKQGLVKTHNGKKMYCDLVFSNINENFIKWIEDLEKYSQDYIFKNREKWFESQLEMEDIENSFAPSLKIFKSGKSYILRTIVPTRLGKCALRIFNEDETEFNNSEFKETTNIITILEIQGIKCSSKSFQIEIEIKQMMVLKPEALFENCIIKRFDKQHTTTEQNVGQTGGQNEQQNENSLENTDPTNAVLQSSHEPASNEHVDDTNEIMMIKTEIPDEPTPPHEPNDIFEIDLDVENITNKSESIKLKDRKEMYISIYREAIKKAREARNLAISCYLEAKEIKKIYKLEDLDKETEEEEEELIEEDFLNMDDLENSEK